MTAPTQAPPTPPGAPEGPRTVSVFGARIPIWTALGVIAVLLVAIMWIWIFSGAARKANPDFVSDRGWAEAAEDRCAETADRVEERSEDAGRQDAQARADAIDASTDDLETMLGDLRDPLPGSASDRAVVEPWLDDYETLLQDRRDYADAVRVNPDARFLTTEKFNDPLDRVVQTFAEVNELFSCVPPGDVG